MLQPSADQPAPSSSTSPNPSATNAAANKGKRAPSSSAPAKAPTKSVSTSMSPISKQDFGFDQARHLLWRAGFGGTPEQIQTLVKWGPQKSVDMLVDYQSIKADPVKADLYDKNIMRPPGQEDRAAIRQAANARDENKLAELRVKRQTAEQEDREQMREIQRWWLTRMVESPRPLEEKMTLFWHGHFATSYRTIEDSYHMFAQNNLFRTHAVGNFGELLHAIIRDPAMIAYLNNNQSRKGKPNENLAREIMELFSLGVGNYTEQDIKEGARALTGYTFQDDTFTFDKKNHDAGNKRILGTSGTLDGDEFVATILAQRACARYIATKLYRFFAHDYPAPTAELNRAATVAIGEMESTLLNNRYAVGPVLKRLFLSQHFYEPAIRCEQIKSPVQLVVGAIRSLNTPTRDLTLLGDAMNMMGQSIFFPPSVKGWDGGRAWINTSTMFIRQNILVFLLTGKRPQGKDALADAEKFNAQPLITALSDSFPGASASNSADILDSLLRFTIGKSTSPSRPALEQYLTAQGNKLDQPTLTGLMTLIAAMPEYQLC